MKFIYLKKRIFWQAVATMVAAMLGAGILGIPFVVAQAGWVPGISYCIGLGLVAMVIHLMVADIITRTRFRHQLVGLARKYLGTGAQVWAAISMMIGGYGALLVYMIGVGTVLSTLLPNLGLSSSTFSLIFYGIASLLVAMGLKLVKHIEVALVALTIILIGILTGVSVNNWSLASAPMINWENVLLPYGVVLFAYGGTSAIFSMREILRGREEWLKPAVILGNLIPIVLYVLFMGVVVGVTGDATTPVAITGLGDRLGPGVTIVGNLFALVSMGMAFLAIGLGLQQMFQFDLTMHRAGATASTVIVPLLLFFLLPRNFIAVMDVAGGLTFGITGLVVVFTYWAVQKAGDNPSLLKLPMFQTLGRVLVAILLLGMVAVIWPWHN